VHKPSSYTTHISPTRPSIPYIPFFSLLHLYRTHSHLYSFRSVHYLATPEIQAQTHIRHFHIDAHEPAMDNWYPQSHIATLSEYEDVAVASNLRGSRPRTLWRRARGAAKGSTGASNTAAPAEKVNVDELRPRVGWTWSIWFALAFVRGELWLSTYFMAPLWVGLRSSGLDVGVGIGSPSSSDRGQEDRL